MVVLALRLPAEWTALERQMFFRGFTDACVIAERYSLAEAYETLVGVDGKFRPTRAWDSHCEAYDVGWSFGLNRLHDCVVLEDDVRLAVVVRCRR